MPWIIFNHSMISIAILLSMMGNVVYTTWLMMSPTISSSMSLARDIVNAVCGIFGLIAWAVFPDLRTDWNLILLIWWIVVAAWLIMMESTVKDFKGTYEPESDALIARKRLRIIYILDYLGSVGGMFFSALFMSLTIIKLIGGEL